jgi:hypothetical protein
VNHPWQQPIKPLEVHPLANDEHMWYPVLFIRPATDRGWQVITHNGILWESTDAMLRTAS